MKIIYNPENGKFDVEDSFLTNALKGTGEPPPDEQWEYYLWGRYRSNHHKVLIVLTGDSKEEIDRRLEDLVKGVEIVEKEGDLKWAGAKRM